MPNTTATRTEIRPKPAPESIKHRYLTRGDVISAYGLPDRTVRSLFDLLPTRFLWASRHGPVYGVLPTDVDRAVRAADMSGIPLYKIVKAHTPATFALLLREYGNV